MYSNNFVDAYSTITSYQQSQEEEQGSIIPNYPKITNQKGSTTNFRKKSFFYDANFELTTHTKGKPPYSYATLITYAINKSPLKRLSLNQIYEWLEQHYPYLKTSTRGWKNSVRHNLSHNPTFYKVSRPAGEPGKGSLWTINETMLNELSCNNLQFDQLKESSTPNHSPASNSDSDFALPQNTQLPRRSTVSDIYHPYFSQNTNTIQTPNLHLTRRYSQPMVTAMGDYSFNSISYHNLHDNVSTTAGFIYPTNSYPTYTQPTSSYMPYQNSIQRLSTNEHSGNIQVQVHHPFGLMPDFHTTTTPPSELDLPYGNFSKIPSTPIILPSNIPPSMNSYTDESIQYSNSNSPDYSQNPYELLTPSELGYHSNNGFYDQKATISPDMLL